MEDSSEKRKQGRPRAYSVEFAAFLQKNFPKMGARGQQNMYYTLEGWNRVKDDPACAWLIEATAGDWKRKTLLSEIGRFPDQASALEAALLMCERRPRVREGALWLRRLRLAHAGVEPQMAATVQDVAEALTTAIDRCLRQYPQTDWATVRQAIETVAVIINEQERRQV